MFILGVALTSNGFKQLGFTPIALAVGYAHPLDPPGSVPFLTYGGPFPPYDQGGFVILGDAADFIDNNVDIEVFECVIFDVDESVSDEDEVVVWLAVLEEELSTGIDGGQARLNISVAGLRKDGEQAPWIQMLADGENLRHAQAPSRCEEVFKGKDGRDIQSKSSIGQEQSTKLEAIHACCYL